MKESGNEFKMAAARGLENVNPEVHQKIKERTLLAEEEDDNVVDKIDQREVFGILSDFLCMCHLCRVHICKRFYRPAILLLKV